MSYVQTDIVHMLPRRHRLRYQLLAVGALAAVVTAGVQVAYAQEMAGTSSPRSTSAPDHLLTGEAATEEPNSTFNQARLFGPQSKGEAEDPGRWVQTHRSSALWSGPDDRAQRFSDIAVGVSLRIVEDAAAEADYLLVEYYGDGESREPGAAWVPAADVGPVLPPNPVPARLDGPPKREIEHRTFRTRTEFISVIGEAARESQAKTDVPASVTVAQAILESDWGQSRLSFEGNNFLGIKALRGPGTAGILTMSTWEVFDGLDVTVDAGFKAYYALEESVDDHGWFFHRNKRYADALKVADDPQAFARAIHAAGYATDPAYADKLIKLMDRHDLYRFDVVDSFNE